MLNYPTPHTGSSYIVQGDTFFKDLVRYPLGREGVSSPGGCVGLAHAIGRFSNIVDSIYALQTILVS